MMDEDPLKKLQSYVVKLDRKNAVNLVEEIIDKKIDPKKALDAMARGMYIVGEKYAKKEYFIPEVLLAAEVMNAGVKLIEPHLKMEKADVSCTIVIGTVRGDIHALGKKLVGIMLKSSGFIVHDLGVNVHPEKFIEKIKETDAKIICMSSLMTTTRHSMKQTIEALKKAGLRDKVKVVIGGGAVSAQYAELIGADAYGRDAVDAVEIAKRFCKT